MNPWGFVVILLGVVALTMGWKGSYRQVWNLVSNGVVSGDSGTNAGAGTFKVRGSPGAVQA